MSRLEYRERKILPLSRLEYRERKIYHCLMGELFRQWKGQCKGPEAEAGFTGSEKSMAPFIQASIQKAASE